MKKNTPNFGYKYAEKDKSFLCALKSIAAFWFSCLEGKKKNRFLNLKVNNNFLELKKMQSACSEMHS